MLHNGGRSNIDETGKKYSSNVKSQMTYMPSSEINNNSLVEDSVEIGDDGGSIIGGLF